MKNIFRLIPVFVCLFLFQNKISAQTDTVRIQTSAICKTCKQTLEHEISFEKGVKSSSLDVPSGVLTIVYHSGKTDAEKLRLAISKIGYDADSVKADQRAYKQLPDCCKHPEQHNE